MFFHFRKYRSFFLTLSFNLILYCCFSQSIFVFFLFFFLWEYCFFFLMGIYLALTDFVGVFRSLTHKSSTWDWVFREKVPFCGKRKSSLLSFLSFECYKASGSNTCIVVVPLFFISALYFVLSICAWLLRKWRKRERKKMCVLTSDQAQLLH